METYRFTNVPDSYTEDDIRALFSACDQSTVNSVCLARSVYTEHAAVATVSFTQPPSFVQKFIPGGTDLHPQPKKRSLVAAFNSPLSSLGIDDPTKKIVVDNDFEGLTPLVESRGDDTIVDVIALTGLAGRAFASWQHPDGQMWLRDHLPGDVISIRILLWGQPSKLEGSDSHLTIQNLRDSFLDELMRLRQTPEDQARPLVLLGHSLGGIIIKAAFVKASQDEKYSHLHTTIHGLVFFGTPHEGMETESWEVIWGSSPPQNLIRDLKPGSSLLKELKEGFLRYGLGLDILSCFEREEMPTAKATTTDAGTKVSRDGPLALYVTESSSCLNLPRHREQTVSVNYTHSLVAKLSGSEGSPYHTIANHIARLVRNARIVVGYRTRRNELVSDLSRIKALLDRGTAELDNTDVLVWVVANEMDNISRTIMGAKVNSSGTSDHTPFDAQQSGFDLNEELQIIERIWQQFRANQLPNPTSQPWHAHADRGLLALRLQAFATAVTPLLLSFRELLDQPQKSETPCFLEKFIGSAAANQLGLDFVTRRRHELEILQDNLLEPTKGSYKEVSTVSDHLRIGEYCSTAGADPQDIILEYRDYAQEIERSANRNILSDLQRRTQQLATQLRDATYRHGNASAGPNLTGFSMSVLRCIAWQHEANARRFVLIYEIPQQIQNCLHDKPSPIRTLQDIVKGLTTGKEVMPLDQIYYIAYQISHTVFRIHTQGWVHKNINPSNIIFMEPRILSNGNFVDQLPERYPRPYLKGFEFSRGKDSLSERLPASDPGNNVYRHPNRQGSLPEQNSTFTQLHDIYAVGTVLFELGRNKTARAVVASSNGQDAKKKLVEEARTGIPKYLGTAFARCVSRCLQGDFGLVNREKDGALLAFAYRRLVVDELKRMAFAGGASVG